MNQCVEIDEVKQNHTGHFFSHDAMECFQSRISEIAWPFDGGYLFWTSEKEKQTNLPRYFKVRYQNSEGRVQTIGSSHATAVRANGVIKTILARGEFPRSSAS